jgi:hypothetical protein
VKHPKMTRPCMLIYKSAMQAQCGLLAENQKPD